PAEQPGGLVPRGSCLIHNWQEERATNHLDPVPGSEGFTHRHGHHGLRVHQLLSRPTNSTTTKDNYRPPHRALLLRQGEAEPPAPGSHEILEKVCPPGMPMESVSTTHRDYRVHTSSLPPHNYCTEQPCSFWLEQARSLPGVTSIRSEDGPFWRNTAFSTPITKNLEQPLPCAPLSSRLRPRKQ
ncbi:Sperm-associated antigen 8, partial [Spheniscus humboldti]